MSTSIISNFASPYEGDFVSLAENLSCRMFRNLLEQSSKVAERYKFGRVPIEPDEITPGRLSTMCWRPEVGALGLALNRGELNEKIWSWVSGSFMLAAFLNDIRPSLDVEMFAPHPLVIAGNVMRGDRFRLKGEADALSVENGSGEPVLELLRVQEGEGLPVWIRSAAVEQGHLIRAGSAGSILITEDEWMDYWLPEIERGTPSGAFRLQKDVLSTSLSLLEEHLPLHFLWTVSLLREVVFLQDEKEGTHSQSFGCWPGHMQLSQVSPVASIVELIHECSHQYFNLLQWHGRVVKPNAPEAFSALKLRRRPLEKILLGFHAFGNALLAVHLLKATKRFEEDESNSQMQILENLTVGLDQQLQRYGSEYLEEMGKDLYQPLRDRLVASQLLPKASA